MGATWVAIQNYVQIGKAIDANLDDSVENNSQSSDQKSKKKKKSKGKQKGTPDIDLDLDMDMDDATQQTRFKRQKTSASKDDQMNIDEALELRTTKTQS